MSFYNYKSNFLNEYNTIGNNSLKLIKLKKNIPNSYDNTRSKSYNFNHNLYELYCINKFGDWLWGYDLYIDSLNEGLIMSYSISLMITILLKVLSNIEYDIGEVSNEVNDNNIIGISLFYNDYEKVKIKLLSKINVGGYYISNTLEDYINDQKIIYIEIEPKYLYECTDYIYDNTDKILYHITLSKYYNKIKNNGLLPKNKNKKTIHPERIYMIEPGSYNKILFILQARNLYGNNHNIIILKIDLNKYNNIRYRFFKDPNHPQGVFIYDTIHPKCVDILYEFDI